MFGKKYFLTAADKMWWVVTVGMQVFLNENWVTTGAREFYIYWW